MPSSWSLKNCCKTGRKMDVSRFMPQMPAVCLLLLLMLPIELPKKNQGIITVMETQSLCYKELKLGAREATAGAWVPVPNAPRLCLAWLCVLKRLCSSVQQPHRSLLEGEFQGIPIKPDWLPELKKSFAFFSALYSFHFGSPPFQHQARQEDSPWLLESVADNTLDLKSLLIFYLDTL